MKATPGAWGSLGAFKRFPGVAGVNLCSAESPRVWLTPLVSSEGFVLLGPAGPFSTP